MYNFKKQVDSRLKILHCERHYRCKHEIEGTCIFEILEGNEKRYQIINKKDILVNLTDIIGRIYEKVGPKLISKLHVEITLIRSI